MIDSSTLLIGIAFSSASLMIALLIGWLNSKHETYLVHGASGIALVMIGVAIMGIREDRYDLLTNLLPFTLILVGFSAIYAGSRLFRNGGADLRPAIFVGVAGLVTMTMAFFLGFSGTGTILLNLWAGAIMLLCAREYWLARTDAPVAMSANAVIYSITASSFLACAFVLVSEAQWVLYAPAKNWAEDFNAIMSLVGLTGIGAITLTLHHARAARRHREEANTDALTGTLNRRALFSQYPETSSVSRHAVLMFDLDHFKQINDRLGHARGDIVLRQFVGVMREELRQVDIIARLGGEEFCVLMPAVDMEKARDAAERIRLGFARLDIAIGDDAIATVSVGLATGGTAETFSSALRRADEALYKAKSAGRNQIQLAPVRLAIA